MSEQPKIKVKKERTRRTPAVKNYLIMQIAAGMALGKPKVALAKELGVPYQRLKELSYTPECKQLIESMTEAGNRTAQAIYANRMPKLMDKAVKVLEDLLDKGDSTTAMFIVRSSIDINKVAPQKEGDTTIQIVMPNSQPQSNDNTIITTTADTLEDGEHEI